MNGNAAEGSDYSETLSCRLIGRQVCQPFGFQLTAETNSGELELWGTRAVKPAASGAAVAERCWPVLVKGWSRLNLSSRLNIAFVRVLECLLHGVKYKYEQTKADGGCDGVVVTRPSAL